MKSTPSVSRTSRRTFAASGKLTQVTLEYSDARANSALRLSPYQIVKIKNEIAVPVGGASKHVGDYLTETEATDLLTEPGVEVTTVPAKRE